MLCIPIQPRSLKELKQKAKKAGQKEVDLIEVWIDHLPKKLDAKSIVEVCPKPVIIVNKSRKEKGSWKGTEKDRIERLKQFALPGVAYIDVGIDTDTKLIKSLVKAKKRAKIIISYHNFTKTPSGASLKEKVKRGFAHGDNMVKIATYAQKPHDNFIALSLLATEKKPLAAMCMGKEGKVSRVLGERFGSALTFTALDSKAKSAPGQLTIEEYKRFDSLLKKP